tara:strand:+ start:679 stop:810 length:132 start_codon:yes stop_codon:yes gene_type:complete
MSNGKGDRPRKVDGKKYRTNFVEIFKKFKPEKKILKIKKNEKD